MLLGLKNKKRINDGKLYQGEQQLDHVHELSLQYHNEKGV